MRRCGGALAFLGAWCCAASAAAWDPFLVENEDVEAGNARMAAEDPEGALARYDAAARALPREPGVHLNRGLALLEAGEHGEARDAFARATEPPASAEIRADAFYDMGLSYYREADAAAAEQDHERAQGLFRDAADAFRDSLRARPGNEDAGWNLELALRRMQEEQDRQEEQDQQEQDQQEQDQQEQDQQEQDQQEQDQQDQNQDQQDQDQDQQDQDGEPQDQDGEPQDQDGEPQDQDGEPQDQDGQDPDQDGQDPDEQSRDENERSDEPPSDTPEPQDEAPQDEPREEQTPAQPTPSDPSADERMRPEHRRVLDALQDGEDNFERERARIRGMRENRRVEQDW